MELDKKDSKILEMLKTNADLTTSQISKKTAIPITTVHNRIRKMKKDGIIKNYTINLDFKKIDKPIKAYIMVSVNQAKSKISQHEIGKRIQKLENVEEVDIVTGTTDILIKIRTKDMDTLNKLITEKLRNIEGIDKTQTMMVLEEI